MTNNVRKKTVKVHLFDVLAAMLYKGHKVTPQDIALHIRNEGWKDADENVIEDAVRVTLEAEMGKEEDHYGLCERNGAYWLDYRISEYN